MNWLDTAYRVGCVVGAGVLLYRLWRWALFPVGPQQDREFARKHRATEPISWRRR